MMDMDLISRVAGLLRNGLEIPFGRGQELAAAALGFDKLASFQAASMRAAVFAGDDTKHIVLDEQTLDRRARQFGIAADREEVLIALRDAFRKSCGSLRVHLSEKHLADELAELAEESALDSDRVAAAFADFNMAYYDTAVFEDWGINLSSVGPGALLEIPFSGFVEGTPDLERPFAGDRVDVKGVVQMACVSRRVFHSPEVTFTDVRGNYDW